MISTTKDTTGGCIGTEYVAIQPAAGYLRKVQMILSIMLYVAPDLDVR